MIAISPQFYFYLESGIFLILFILVIFSTLRLKSAPSKTRLLILLFLLSYSLSVAFSAIAKWYKFYYNLTPSDLETFSLNYGVNLLLQARFKYLFTIMANTCFHLVSYEIFSRPKGRYSRFVGNLTSIVATLYFMPIFNSTYKLLISLSLFVHSLVVYLPILIESRKMIARTSAETKKVIRGTFYMSMLLISLLIIAILDIILTNFGGMAYSFTYYLAWVDVLVATSIAFRIFVFPNWSFVSRDIGSTIKKQDEQSPIKKHGVPPSPMMFIVCPICNTAKYYLLPEEMRKKVSESPSGIASMLIPPHEICEHTYVVHLDKNFKVRNTQPVDFIA